MDFSLFSDRARNISPSSHIYNLSGSSMALFLVLQDKPFIMVEQTEETAEELQQESVEEATSLAESIEEENAENELETGIEIAHLHQIFVPLKHIVAVIELRIHKRIR